MAGESRGASGNWLGVFRLRHWVILGFLGTGPECSLVELGGLGLRYEYAGMMPLFPHPLPQDSLQRMFPISFGGPTCTVDGTVFDMWLGDL